MTGARRSILALFLALLQVACNTDAKSPAAPTVSVLASRPAPVSLTPPTAVGAIGPVIAFPPRNEPFEFGQRLDAYYRDTLRRPIVTSNVDLEGWIVWLQEYTRYRVNGCGHDEAVNRVLAQIQGGGVQAVCGPEQAGGTVTFPPRNEPVAFGSDLNRHYRDVMGRGQVSAFVDLEGWIVWISEYLRYRLNWCNHTDATTKVLQQIAGQGVQPVCTPPGPRTSFGAGTYLVNRDIVAGRFFTDPASGCYFERLRGLGGSLSDIIANEFIGYNAGQWIVDILASDLAFKPDGDCGTWTLNNPVRGAQTTIPPGMWLVGGQITPGIYRVDAQYGCYWERLRDFTNTIDGIIDNDFVDAPGQQLVEIRTSDAGFSTDDDCGTWTRVAGATTSGTAARSATDLERNWQRHREKTGLSAGLR